MVSSCPCVCVDIYKYNSKILLFQHFSQKITCLHNFFMLMLYNKIKFEIDINNNELLETI
jgi:hypothetical protein